MDFPGGSDSEEFAWNAVDLDSISGLERSPGEGNDYPLQYSCLENSMDRGAWWATVHRVTKSWTGLSNYHFHFFFKILGNNGYPIEICFFLIGTSQRNLDKLQRKKSVLLSSGKSKYLTFKTHDQDLGTFISVFNSSADNKNSFIPPMLWPYHPKVTVEILTPYGNKQMKERHFTHTSVTALCIILDHGFLSLIGTILIEWELLSF